jgi:hypothetical protein
VLLVLEHMEEGTLTAAIRDKHFVLEPTGQPNMVSAKQEHIHQHQQYKQQQQ